VRAVPGSGLGLAIVAQIARAHGGTASVDSADGGGALFTLKLPYASPQRET
jgi:signal transduction histidine kinase